MQYCDGQALITNMNWMRWQLVRLSYKFGMKAIEPLRNQKHYNLGENGLEVQIWTVTNQYNTASKQHKTIFLSKRALMNQLTRLLLAILFLSVCSMHVFGQANTFRCIVMGEVVDRPYSKELLLTKEDGDPRVSATRIPIENNKFYYELEADHQESYALIFADEFENAAWRPVIFFAEPDTVRLTLHPEDRFAGNVLVGGEVNQQLVAFERNIEDVFGIYTLGNKQTQLMAENRFFTEEAIALQNAIRQAETDETRDSLQRIAQVMDSEQKHLTTEALEVTKLFREKFLEWLDWKTTQVMADSSLVTYRELLSFLRMAKVQYSEPVPIAIPDLLASFEKQYRPRYPDHPYTEAVETYLESVNRIKEGGEYIDFTAPDFEGNAVTLSERIKGKIAVINLWASWCGPCRRKGIELIPVYEEYKDRGFEIVGVARERDKEMGVRAVQMDQYPWLNLLEINDSQKIWGKYGLDNSGGGVFLVDETGVILAVGPTADEVRAILAERLE